MEEKDPAGVAEGIVTPISKKLYPPLVQGVCSAGCSQTRLLLESPGHGWLIASHLQISRLQSFLSGPKLSALLPAFLASGSCYPSAFSLLLEASQMVQLMQDTAAWVLGGISVLLLFFNSCQPVHIQDQ